MHRRHRLTHSGRFRQVRRQGQSWFHPLLVLLALRSDLPCSRFGFLVGKRIGRAAVRNRVKRLMREAVRARLAYVSPGWDIVLVARMPIVQADFWRIGEALGSLLLRLREASDNRPNSSGSL